MHLDLLFHPNTPKKESRRIARLLLAAFLYHFVSKDGAVISNITKMSPRGLYNLSRTDEWKQACNFWQRCADVSLQGEYFHAFVARQKANEIRKTKRKRRRKKGKDPDGLKFNGVLHQWTQLVKSRIHIESPDDFCLDRQKTPLSEQIDVDRLSVWYHPKQTLALIANTGLTLIVSISLFFYVFIGGQND